jgi:hypothetical protein
VAKLRRLIVRACAVCEWSEASLVRAGALRDADCPWCHAPTRVEREEWLFDSGDLRAQAAAFGRLGGLIGGRTRAQRLSPARRREIARAAAAARWRRR